MERAEDQACELRDKFAMAALTGLIASEGVSGRKVRFGLWVVEEAVDRSYKIADSMLIRRQHKRNCSCCREES